MRAVVLAVVVGSGLTLAASALPAGALAADRQWEICAGSDDDKAIPACGQVIARGSKETRGNRAIAFYNRGVSYRNKGDNQKALADYDAALKLNPRYASAYNGRANIKSESGDLDGAISDYNRALKFDPKNPSFLRNRALAFVAKGAYSAALADYDRAVPLDPSNAVLLYNRGEVYEKQGLALSAAGDFRKALELKPGFADAEQALARVTGTVPPGAQGGSEDAAWAACAGADDDKSIVGCTEVLARGSRENQTTQASAYHNRGVSYRNKGEDTRALADYEMAITLKADYASPYNGRANIRLDRGDIEGALADYAVALRLEPNNAQFLRNRGLAFAKKDDLAAARADFDASIASDPNNHLTFYNRAEVLERLGDRDGAIADYRQALSLSSDFTDAREALKRLGAAGDQASGAASSGSADRGWDDCASSDAPRSVKGCTVVLGRGSRESLDNRALAFRNRAISQYALRDYAAALADLDQSLALKPNDAATLQTRGETLARQGECGRAIADFDRVMALDPKNANAYLGRSDCRRIAKDFDGAIADATTAMALDGRSPGAPLALGNVYTDRNEFERATIAYDTALGLAPERADIYIQRGNVHLFRGRMEAAVADYDRAAALDPASLDAYNGRGVVENYRGQQEAAIADFGRAIALDAAMSMLYINRGEVLLDLGRKAEADADLDRAIAIDTATLARIEPTHPVGFNALLGRAYARVLKGELDAGIADANAALAIDPRSKEALDTRGLGFAGQRNFPRAIADLTQGIAIGGYVTQIYRHRAETYEASGHVDLAIEDYEAVLRLAPGHAIAKAGLARARQALAAGVSVARADTAPATGKASVPLGRRVALIIGNAAYQRFGQLPNPRRDADRLAATLRAVGFSTVTVASDLTNQGFNDTLRSFARDADGADWAMIYYAGHGMEIQNTNYLVPVDAQLSSDRDVQFEAVPLERMIASIEGAKGMRLVILDACRENPFAVAMRRASTTRSATRGLARVEPEGGTLVAYAAKAGQLAQDGTSGANSPFVEALVRRIETPGIEIGKLFRLVRDDVLAATGRQQEPFVYGSLPSEDMFINPGR